MDNSWGLHVLVEDTQEAYGVPQRARRKKTLMWEHYHRPCHRFPFDPVAAYPWSWRFFLLQIVLGTSVLPGYPKLL